MVSPTNQPATTEAITRGRKDCCPARNTRHLALRDRVGETFRNRQRDQKRGPADAGDFANKTMAGAKLTPSSRAFPNNAGRIIVSYFDNYQPRPTPADGHVRGEGFEVTRRSSGGGFAMSLCSRGGRGGGVQRVVHLRHRYKEDLRGRLVIR